MQRRGSAIYHFEMFFIGVDGEEMMLAMVVSCGNSGSTIIQLFVIIWGNFLLRK